MGLAMAQGQWPNVLGDNSTFWKDEKTSDEPSELPDLDKCFRAFGDVLTKAGGIFLSMA